MKIPRILRRFWSPRPSPSTFQCPQCGAPVRSGSLGCRACGSDAETGWSASADEDGADTGNALDDFDYEAYLDREFSSGQGTRNGWNRKALFALVIALIASLVFMSR